MYDIWNPATGCTKCSEGCQNCYMYTMEHRWGRDGENFKINKTTFNYPIKRNRQRQYKVIPGSKIRIGMMTDFFLPELDKYREELWEMIRLRSDVEFYILTKRPERILSNLPSWYIKNGYKGLDNVSFNVTCENQKRADQRLDFLRDLPVTHKGIMIAPFIGEIHIEKYLQEGWIENVQADGERGYEARPCRYEWVKCLSEQCRLTNTKFTFIGTGSNFIVNDEVVQQYDKKVRKNNARLLNLNVEGRPIEYKGVPKIKKLWGDECKTCGAQPICNGLNPLTGKCD